MESIKTLFSSSRFQGVLAIGILQALLLFNIITNVQMEGLVQIIQGIIATAVVIRSVDRIGDKIEK